MIESAGGRTPVLEEGAVIHPMAYVSGDVTLKKNASIFPTASVRGDEEPIVLGEGANVQDNATVHTSKGHPAVLGNFVTVGHNAVVHGAEIGEGTIVGMGAIVLDGAVVGRRCMIGAGALIPSRKVIPDYAVVVGNPYRILKVLDEASTEGNMENALEYVRLSRAFLDK